MFRYKAAKQQRQECLLQTALTAPSSPATGPGVSPAPNPCLLQHSTSVFRPPVHQSRRRIVLKQHVTNDTDQLASKSDDDEEDTPAARVAAGQDFHGGTYRGTSSLRTLLPSRPSLQPDQSETGGLTRRVVPACAAYEAHPPDVQDKSTNSPAINEAVDKAYMEYQRELMKKAAAKEKARLQALREGKQPVRLVEDLILGTITEQPADDHGRSPAGASAAAAAAAREMPPGDQSVPTALIGVLKRLDVHSRKKNPYLQGAFGRSVPIWKLVEEVAAKRGTKKHKDWLLGGGDLLSQCRQLVQRLQPLVGHYVELRKRIAFPGCSQHQFAVWRMKLADVPIDKALCYESPHWEAFIDGRVKVFGAGTSYKDHPAQVVYSYSLLPDGFALLADGRQKAVTAAEKAGRKKGSKVKRSVKATAGAAAAAAPDSDDVEVSSGDDEGSFDEADDDDDEDFCLSARSISSCTTHQPLTRLQRQRSLSPAASSFTPEPFAAVAATAAVHSAGTAASKTSSSQKPEDSAQKSRKGAHPGPSRFKVMHGNDPNRGKCLNLPPAAVADGAPADTAEQPVVAVTLTP